MYKVTRREIQNRFFLILTDQQMEKYAAENEITKRDLHDDICDTINRDLLIDAIVLDVLGNDYEWPTNSHSREYADDFYPRFFRAADYKGLAVEPIVLVTYDL
jgi:hypothetical protein